MKIHFSTAILFLFASLLFFTNVQARDIPMEVGNFVLGSNITDYPDVESSNFLKEVVIYDWHGFKKGVISHGICDAPGKIVKIKLKYEDSSKKFFDTLLKKYKKKYGKPDQWKGDSFGIHHVWKWRFVDKDNNRVHLILQHNARNPDENHGNMVKLSLPDQVVREQECFTKACTSRLDKQDQKQLLERKKGDWHYFIPRELE
ncbi:MAG: hypothetical protein ABFR63_06890 [Thermodesulfobacteriota bacterium]